MEHLVSSVGREMVELLLRVLPITFVALFGTELDEEREKGWKAVHSGPPK